MKRSCDGTFRLHPTLLDCYDLQCKIRALVDLSTEASEQFSDSYLVYIEPDKDDKSKHNIKFNWYCGKFTAREESNRVDPRDHEGLLRKHFKSFNLLIHKKDHCWDILVSSPATQPGVHSVQL